MLLDWEKFKVTVYKRLWVRSCGLSPSDGLFNNCERINAKYRHKGDQNRMTMLKEFDVGG